MFEVGDRVRRKIENQGEFAWDGGDDIHEVREVLQDGNSIKLKGRDEAWFGPKFELVEPSLDEEIADLEAKLKTLRDRRDKEKFSEQLNAALKEMALKVPASVLQGVDMRYRFDGGDYTFVLTCSRT